MITSASEKKHIVVIGAGVIGLSTSIKLLETGNFNVTILAKRSVTTSQIPGIQQVDEDFPNVYTSSKAGAYWNSLAESTNIKQQEIEWATLQELKKYLPNKKAGLLAIKRQSFYLKKSYKRPWFAEKKELKYREIPPEESQFGPEISGYEFDTVSILPYQYLQFLVNKFREMGGILLSQVVYHIRDAVFGEWTKESPFGSPVGVVNCTGLGSKTLGGVNDNLVFPIRGQMVLVKSPDYPPVSFGLINGNQIFYTIPRCDGTVFLGGTFESYKQNTIPEAEISKTILEWCIKHQPKLLQNGKYPEIVSHSVGFRPGRIGGPRIEFEIKDGDRKWFVCHNYGHGGEGYHMSWGSGMEVVKKIESGLKRMEAVSRKANL